MINKWLTLLCIALLPMGAAAAGSAKKPRQVDWQFGGIFGTFDDQAVQRGFQVYKNVCSSCHAMDYVAYRHLQHVGFSEAEVKAIAAEYLVEDGPNDDGEMFERAGRPSDNFVAPYPNKKAAMAANGGAYPPNLSLIVKARKDGANYLYSLLTGYEETPEGLEIPEGKYYNPYYPGGVIAMPPQLSDDLVEYQDGTEATMDQLAKDLTVFLQWTAEGEMERRKSMGIKVMLYLLGFTILFKLAKDRVWRDVKKK